MMNTDITFRLPNGYVVSTLSVEELGIKQWKKRTPKKVTNAAQEKQISQGIQIQYQDRDQSR